MHDVRRALSLLALVWLAAPPALAESAAGPAEREPAAPAAATPTAAIDALHANLLDVMKNAVALGYAGREEKLRTVIPRYFDVDYMAAKMLGPHWNSLDADSRRRYLETFERFMVANYAGRFDDFSGQSFETLGEVPGRRDMVIVKSRLVDPTDKNVNLDYTLRQVGSGWKVIDVFLDGKVSELALRRAEFVSIVQRQNLDALLVALDAKIAKLKAGGEG